VGDFGHATCGYRHELRAKLVLSLLKVAEARLHVADDGTYWFRPLPRGTPFVDVLPPPPVGGYGSLQRDTLLTSLGKQRLAYLHKTRPHPPPPPRQKWRLPSLGFARWVDDFVSFLSGPSPARLTLAATAFLHRCFGVPLNADKSFMDPATDFSGLVFDGHNSQVGIPDDKRVKYLSYIDELLEPSHFARDLLRKFLGAAVWCCLALPLGKRFLSACFTLLHDPKGRQALTLVARGELLFWKVLLTDAPMSRTVFAAPATASSAEVVVHIDWAPAGGLQKIGIVILSHGLYTSTHVPQWFLDFCPPSSAPSSPAFEAFALVSYFACFPDLAANRTSRIYTDNDPFLMRSSAITSSGSPPFDAALKLGALHALQLNAHYTLARVPSALNVANWLTHVSDQTPQLEHALHSAGIFAPFFPRSPVLPTPPSAWKALQHSSRVR